MNAIVTTEPRPNLAAGGKPHAIVPQTMEEAYRLAKAVCLAGMAPKGMDTPERAMIAIMRGLEVGMTPFQALDKIAIVNGRPTIWGDGAIGLVRGSGLCEYIKEWIEGEGDNRVAHCEAKRRGEPSPIVRKFSVDDAKRAGLWGKQGPWQQFQERMLQMRARGFTLRDGFADVLGGLYLREEIEEDRATSTRDVTPPRREPPPPMLERKPTPPAPDPVEIVDEPPAPKSADIRDPDRVVETFLESCEAAKDASDVFEAWRDTVEPVLGLLFPLDLDVCERIKRDTLARFQK